MEILFKVIGYFLLWTLYSYLYHVLAHVRSKYNLLQYIHLKHHGYKYDGSIWPPWNEYFFWFGDLRSSMDVYLAFTLPLVILTIFDPIPGAILLVFHYFYELFLSRNVLDHNPKITGKITRFMSIGSFHLKHHSNVRCNFSFFITFWDYLFRTDEKSVKEKRRSQRLKSSKISY
ncbi:hypothetical protein BS333_18010 [Vibrio azureus]|uniref:Fatty acid hydroxylase domain-containing protein n=1 Tax=Vibrio azureus NBRC 104587 TaxID=1219077 RepID=U3CHW3_9VIBR|nr:sterol desaturase family protein [Vibrio azureus]AUI88246.1 hypothetical protein BS333_18010 [Vibrio azureus]GAD77823.1 hypothetical protein VAZ01S_094_00160 [Vibrio azureus NBRC 104587]